MRFTFSRAALQASLALFIASMAGFASAQSIKPGLWETTGKIGGEKGSQFAAAILKMQEQMTAMPPEQRKKMAEMMTKQGMPASFGTDGVNTTKICISKEMVDAGQTPANTEGKCTRNNGVRIGNVQKFSFSCTEPLSSGEGVMTFQGNESYSTVMSIIANRQGKTEKVTIEGNSKFLSSECGNVKPLNTLIPKS